MNKKEERGLLRDAQEELSNVYRDVRHLVETLDLISKVLNQELEGFWANVRLGLPSQDPSLFRDGHPPTLSLWQ